MTNDDRILQCCLGLINSGSNKDEDHQQGKCPLSLYYLRAFEIIILNYCTKDRQCDSLNEKLSYWRRIEICALRHFRGTFLCGIYPLFLLGSHHLPNINFSFFKRHTMHTVLNILVWVFPFGRDYTRVPACQKVGSSSRAHPKCFSFFFLSFTLHVVRSMNPSPFFDERRFYPL